MRWWRSRAPPSPATPAGPAPEECLRVVVDANIDDDDAREAFRGLSAFGRRALEGSDSYTNATSTCYVGELFLVASNIR
jgi:hypothetical protein